MHELVAFFSSFGEWNWVVLGVLLFFLEFIVPGVHFLWFGVAALLTAMVAFVTGIGWQLELIVFAVLALATVFAVRRYVNHDGVPSDAPSLNVRGAQYVGRVVTVVEAIKGGRGKVRVGDSIWQAEGADAAEGVQVMVAGARDTVLLVKPTNAT
ncbi:MAG: NfeD family protein [Hyphomicrobiaceae bacterium]